VVMVSKMIILTIKLVWVQKFWG